MMIEILLKEQSTADLEEMLKDDHKVLFMKPLLP